MRSTVLSALYQNEENVLLLLGEAACKFPFDSYYRQNSTLSSLNSCQPSLSSFDWEKFKSLTTILLTSISHPLYITFTLTQLYSLWLYTNTLRVAWHFSYMHWTFVRYLDWCLCRPLCHFNFIVYYSWYWVFSVHYKFK